MGNICRSPAAEAILNSISLSDEVDIQVDSAGTESYHVGNLPDERMRAAAKKRGIPMVSHARQVTAKDLAAGEFDWVIAMDHANMRRLRSISSEELSPHVRLFSDFLDDQWPDEVPDPYYGGDDGFEYVLDMLEAGCPGILESLSSS
ncbi:protein-tyrosine phosphatase [Neorhodopirellula lusitana]|uniref:protein-tyrosine-phosphatase n=2 Tax=Neorhodopirellula lusitana TaxID=445327 RepID=A0ABY1PRI1_9BACT|nr:protein-tyrosine phosphatase [Neorhodopirellula lusitana]